MHGANKILTVSYGTFSCTLEGFEDSFGTMKAIAEYFRDLAADDRFFGAEPPTPDTEMLQRIAEREIRNRVEARVGEDGIVLRPAALTAQEPPPVFADRPPPPAAPAARPEAGDRGADEPESVAAKLARIRAVVETARATAPQDRPPPAPHGGDAPPPPGPEGHPDPKSPDPVAEAPEMSHAGPAAEPRAATGATAEAPGHDRTEDDTAPLPEATPTPAADGAGAETTATDAAAPVIEDATARVLAALDRSAPPQTPPAPEPAPVRARARVLKLKRDDLAAHWPEVDPARAAKSDTPRPAPATTTEMPEDEIPEDEARLPDALEAELQAELAAVRAEFDTPATPAPETAPTDADEDSAEAEPAATAMPDPLRAEAVEADPETETAEAAPEETAAEDMSPEETDADAPTEQPASGTAPAPVPTPDPERVETALQRLWDETNTKLDGAEQKRRRASIAHLKAAVAATFADRKGGTAQGNAEDERARRPYRQVLAKVVRGNRERGTTGRPDKGGRLAPLMLVSEQRVDAERPEPDTAREAIRPRRVSPEADQGEAAAQETIGAAESGFADFVAARDPAGIAGVLETAAAYLQTVQGQAHFSRPQVLRLAMEHLGPGTAREEVLRAFGGLLRIGTFKKVKRGDFVLTTVETGGDAPEAERRHA